MKGEKTPDENMNPKIQHQSMNLPNSSPMVVGHDHSVQDKKSTLSKGLSQYVNNMKYSLGQ